MNYQAIIFDLDGVLCSTDRYHYLAWKLLANELGLTLDSKKSDRLRGVSRMESLNIVMEGWCGKPLSLAEKELLAERKNAFYRSYLEAMSPKDLSAEVRWVLTQLRAGGYLMAVGSSSKNTPLILQRLGLENTFDTVVDGNSIAHSKPHPEVFQEAASRLGLPADQCLVVEDAASGVAAAIAGGFHCAGIGPAASVLGVTYPLDTLKDLLRYC